jgi:DNA-binding response OmpR family regulator
MSAHPSQTTFLVIGSDPMLSYLLNRYAEQSGCQMLQRVTAPGVVEMRQLKPAAIIFSSLEYLHAAQALVEDLAVHEILVLVCVSVADEVRARELGADACLFHPLTYDNFCATLSAVNLPGKVNPV